MSVCCWDAGVEEEEEEEGGNEFVTTDRLRELCKGELWLTALWFPTTDCPMGCCPDKDCCPGKDCCCCPDKDCCCCPGNETALLPATCCTSPAVGNPPDVPLLLAAEEGDNWLTVDAEDEEVEEEETTAGDPDADDTGVLLALFAEPAPDDEEWSVEFSTFSVTVANHTISYSQA